MLDFTTHHVEQHECSLRHRVSIFAKYHLIGIIFVAFFPAILLSCTYSEDIALSRVTVKLSEPLEDANVEMTSSLGTTFRSLTNANGEATFTLPPGIYSASVSVSTDNGYTRHVYSGNLLDVVVSGETVVLNINIVSSTVQLNNPILIKEIYVGGCQKDDGSGTFAIDKCVILYNNSDEPASLDNVAFGIIEPYNGEATAHSFLNNGLLFYENDDWIPAINGIWYFQNGHFIQPYSELVVNIYGCIDNTKTYSGSVNYSNPEYFTMYDVEAASSDGGKYNNTNYYPSPSEVIPTSHYLKAVKYGQSNAWPISQSSPAIVIFRTEDITPGEYAGNPANIIYPADKEGNLIYACLRLPRSWILDAVEVFNAEKITTSKKRLTPDLDNSYVEYTCRYGHALIRKVESVVDGHNIYQDTNNSANDFYETETFSLH